MTPKTDQTSAKRTSGKVHQQHCKNQESLKAELRDVQHIDRADRKKKGGRGRGPKSFWGLVSVYKKSRVCMLKTRERDMTLGSQWVTAKIL